MHADIHMNSSLLLASSSEIRSQLLKNAGVEHQSQAARIDEESIKAALLAEDATPRDIADTLAEMKACKLSKPGDAHLVLGCDQVLSFKGSIFSKPKDVDEARAQLSDLRGQTHQLLSAAVIYEAAEPVWRHVGVARLTMRDFSDAYLDAYLARTWDSIRWSVGGYKIEEEGVRLFSAISGDLFTIQGLPLLPLLSYLTLRGTLPA